MPDFEIKITTPVELEGAKQLADQLERNIGKAKALGQATDELEGKLKTVQSAIANAGEAAKEGAEKGFGEMIEGHHGIHAIGHALNQALPGLAQFTRFLTSGFTAAIGVALLAFEYLKSKIEEFNKLLDDLSTGPGARGEWAEKIAENTRSAAVETAVFNEKLRELEDRQESLAKSTDELIARQKKQAADSLAIADAQKELDLARLALAEKLGQVTPEQAVMIKLQIDDAAFKRQLEAEKAAIQAELSARQGELAGLQGQEPSLGRAMDRANATALAAANAQATNEAKLTQEQADLKAAQDSLAKSEALLLQPHHFGDRADTFMREEAEKNAEQQQRAIASLSQAIA
jgi:chromosome segregation ATPase